MNRPNRLQRVGRIAFYALASLLLCILAGLGVTGAIDSTQPVRWGTFTEESCESRARGGCRSLGTWVSDDGTITRREVYLDGRTEPGGIVRAGYRPAGIIDHDNDIVHTEVGIGGGVWMPWVFAAGFLGCTVAKAYEWGHLRPASLYARGRGRHVRPPG